jgi:hypothetical protein
MKTMEKADRYGLLAWLNNITSSGIPITWDRVTDNGDSVKVYGWIPRKDGQRDFVLVDENEDGLEFTTSSAKYSKAIAKALAMEPGNHVPCIPFATFFKNIEISELYATEIKNMTGEST